MVSNLNKFKKDLEKLIITGNNLLNSIQLECYPSQVRDIINKKYSKEEAKKLLDEIPDFKESYQVWYSEAKVLIKQLLRERLEDFIRLFEKPKTRKEISFENYKIEDYLQGLSITRGYDKQKVVGPEAAIPLFQQQIAIVKAIKNRFESSLFDIQNILQADLFDSELDSAKELAKNKFYRAAGVVSGVVLEKHLDKVCESHSLHLSKRNSTIADFNNILKENGIIETSQWRFIQLLGDLRNLCCHDKKTEPIANQVTDLISGVEKVIKSIF
jgi:hypothetical protein